MKTPLPSHHRSRLAAGGHAILIATFLAPAASAMSEPGILWKRAHFEVEAAALHAIAGNGTGRLIAVGDGGVIRRSENHGDTWFTPSPDVHHDLRDVLWDGARFTAVGGMGYEKGLILSSTDGANWQQSCLGASQILFSVCSNGPRMLVVGNNNSCFHSDDLRSWSGLPIEPKTFHDCLWDGGKFVRVGRGRIETSPDGVTWTSRHSADPNQSLAAIARSGSACVVVGYDWSLFATVLLRSTDGLTWSPVDPGIAPSVWLDAVEWTGARFVAAGTGGDVLTSPDGIAWSHHTTGVTAGIHDLVWTGGRLFAVGDRGLILRSSEAAPDGPADWESLAPVFSPPEFSAFAQADVAGVNRIVAVGSNGLTSYSDDDGVTGADAPPVTSVPLRAVTATGLGGSRKFIAVGSFGVILNSPDGATWNVDTSTVSSSLEGVAWADFLNPMTPDRVIAVGHSGTILTGESSPLWHWTARTSPTSELLYSVAAGVVVTGKPPLSSTLAVAVGDQGTILTSPDGVNWTARSSGTDASLRRVIPRTGGGFIAVGSHGVVLTSATGVTWTRHTTATSSTIFDVASTGSQYVAVGLQGAIDTSPDGISWTRRHAPTLGNLQAVLASSSGRLLAGGAGGLVLTSDPAPDFADWMASQSPPPGMDGPDDDPNGDGLTNLMAYGFGIPAVAPPAPADHARLPCWAAPTSARRVRLRLRPSELTLPDLIYHLESSPNLTPGSWSEVFRYEPGQACGTGAVDLHLTDHGSAEIELLDAIGFGSSRFYRFRLEKIP